MDLGPDLFLIWLLVIVFLQASGAILHLAIGRPAGRALSPGQAGPAPSASPRPTPAEP